jgi:lipoyl(octanoyl) transferase
MSAGPLLRVCDLTGRLTRYLPSLQLQELLVELRKADKVPDTLLLVQHAPVYTVGKRGCSADFRQGEQVIVVVVVVVVWLLS